MAGHADPQAAAWAAAGQSESWACTLCTLVNSSQLAVCGACSSARPGGLGRSDSAAVAEAAGVPRARAREALQAAGGDVHRAVSYLLDWLEPHAPPGGPEQRPPEAELADFGGITVEAARQHLAATGGDMRAAKQAVLLATLPQEEVQKLDIPATRQPLMSNAAPFDCPVCFCPAASGEGVLVRACGHSFCRECTEAHVREQLEGGGTGLVTCPAQGCLRFFEHRELRALAGADSLGKLDRRALEQGAAADPTMHLCPTPDCTYIVSWAGEQDGAPRCQCPLCGQSTCLACGVRPYHGGFTCAAWVAHQRQQQTAEEQAACERATQEFLARSNIRICRRCKVPIIKEVGCDKMKCRCGYRFCYHCGTENAQCGCTPGNHGFWDNQLNVGDFRGLRQAQSAT
eukprot:TRINITY_DN23216_c0_g1_i1.p1 TRINITY_DN23216_c0_g1~~TRINITY_DN23216_c0_g1_i1.p1  ORF type:complete len:401 (+),score=59.94 TRINITY_DN23216_c0_g1_i1:76-1278(+)